MYKFEFVEYVVTYIIDNEFKADKFPNLDCVLTFAGNPDVNILNVTPWRHY